MQINEQLKLEGSLSRKRLSLGDFPTGGSIGTASQTVDIYPAIDIAQTTVGQTITIPTPTLLSYTLDILVSNNGTASFTILGQIVPVGQTITVSYSSSGYVVTSNSSSVGQTNWGSIGGTITNQTDLQSALALKENTANKGIANGYASLDSSGKLPASQLTTSAMEYKGTYNATTNTPSLVNGTGDTGDFYKVAVAGSHDFGAGIIDLGIGDELIYNGSVYEKILASNPVPLVTVFNVSTNTVVPITTQIVEYNVNASGGNTTITLPAIAQNTGMYTIRKTDSSTNTVTVIGQVNGQTNAIIQFQNTSITLTSDLIASYRI